MHVGRTLLRYLAGALVLGIVICVGIVIRIVHFAQPHDEVAADAIVVLGAAQYNGTPSSVFAARLDHAAALFHDGRASHIITVGGSRPGDIMTEAQAGEQYLHDAGVPSEALVPVETGGDTLVSLRAADEALTAHGWDSVVIVTDPWHEQRCRMIARDLGLAVQVSPVTEGPATADSVEARYVARELLGTLFYRLVGGSSGAGSPVM